MARIQARKLLKYDPDTLWDIIYGDKIEVVFDDGVLVMSATEIILSVYCWVYHVSYPKLPLLKKHTIQSMYKNGRSRRAMHIDLMNNIYSLLLDVMGITDSRYTYAFVEVAVRTNNKLYNRAYYTTARYTISTSIMDDIELLLDPKLTKLKDDLLDREINEEIVSETINNATDLLNNDIHRPDGKVNRWSWLASRGLVKTKQLLQNSFMRGYITDTDGFVIDYPILYSYLTGMITYRAYNIVARENAVAVESQQDELRRASSDSRRMTYAASYKRGIVYHDCGSTDYITYEVKDQNYLNILAGSYVFNEKLQSLQRVESTHTHLIGKSVKVRSQITCKVEDPTLSCSVCVGALAESIPHGVNMGADVSREIHRIIIQMKMSKKHYLDSSSGNVSDVSPEYHKGFRETRARDIFLRDSLWKRAKRIIFKIPAINTNILGVYDVKSVHMMTLSQVSTIKHLELKIDYARTKFNVDLDTQRGGIKAMFSYRALEFLHNEFKNGYERINLKGDTIEIDMTGFDFRQPIMKRPNVAPDGDMDNKYLIDLYERVGVDNKQEMDSNNILETLQAIIDTSADMGMRVSLGVIETILSAYICQKGTYRLSRGFHDTTHESALKVLSNRSLAMASMHRDQKRIVTSVNVYLQTDRDDSVLDVVMDPVGVLKKYKIHPAQLQNDVRKQLKR